MSGFRLAVIAVAAFSFLQLDLADTMAQDRSQAYQNAYRNQNMGPGGSNAKKSRTRRDQPQEDQPAGDPRGMDQPSDDPRGSSRTRSRRSRSRSSSRSNAIKSNPILRFFDEDGDGELSLEEIDAASRLLYSLDVNEDDRITSDEVEDMIAEEGGRDDRGSDRDSGRNDRRADNSLDGPPSRGSNRSSRTRTSSRNRSSRGGDSGAAAAPGKFAGGAGSAAIPGMPPMGGGGGGGGGGAPDADDFDANDKNGDGFLTRSEMPRAHRSKFTKMDTNGDKEIDPDEFYDFLGK